MPRSVALVALWAVFAVASVSVGFAAAGLVSDPSPMWARRSRRGLDVLDRTAHRSSSSTPDASTRREPATPDHPHGHAAPPRAPLARRAPRPAAARPVPSRSRSSTRHLNTRGGYVSATCRDGPGLGRRGAGRRLAGGLASRRGRVATARRGASAAVTWGVEVSAACSGGLPRFVPGRPRRRRRRWWWRRWRRRRRRHRRLGRRRVRRQRRVRLGRRETGAPRAAPPARRGRPRTVMPSSEPQRRHPDQAAPEHVGRDQRDGQVGGVLQ